MPTVPSLLGQWGIRAKSLIFPVPQSPPPSKHTGKGHSQSAAPVHCPCPARAATGSGPHEDPSFWKQGLGALTALLPFCCPSAEGGWPFFPLLGLCFLFCCPTLTPTQAQTPFGLGDESRALSNQPRGLADWGPCHRLPTMVPEQVHRGLGILSQGRHGSGATGDTRKGVSWLPWLERREPPVSLLLFGVPQHNSSGPISMPLSKSCPLAV